MRFSSSLFITAAFFFALLLRTGYAIFRKYALQMNHQMIVAKLQPLWMLLLRGSTRVCSEHTGCGWLTFGVGCPGSGGASPAAPAMDSTAGMHEAEESIAHRLVHILLLNMSFSNTKTPAGKGHCHLEEAQWSYPLAPQEPCRGVKSEVTINSARIAWKHCAMDSFQPPNILSWKGDCRDFLQTQTSPCTFYNQIPYLDLAQHKLA